MQRRWDGVHLIRAIATVSPVEHLGAEVGEEGNGDKTTCRELRREGLGHDSLGSVTVG